MSGNEAYNLGCDAANDYVPRDQNPYEVGTEDHREWDEGWQDADIDLSDEGEEDD
jgi:hypothetical protein